MFTITGRVIHGAHLGKTLGFPTANLDRREFVRRKLKIKFGIYAGLVKLKIENQKLKIYRAGVVIGPLDKYQLPKIEAHLLGFKGNLYGKKVSLELKKYLREFKYYESAVSLRKQIIKDLRIIRRLKI